MNQESRTQSNQVDPGKWANVINGALKLYADKDWNYSRITLHARPLKEIEFPYVLWVDLIDLHSKKSRQSLRDCANEVTWGSRHSSELGVLEIISLRLNKALLEATTDSYWQDSRPIIRLVKREELERQGINSALWYEVKEVRGEDFDER